MTPAFFLHLIWSRRWLILLVVVLTVVSGHIIAANSVQKYTASTTLVLGFGDTGPFEATNLPQQQSAAYLATQIDIIRSRQVAEQTIKTLSDATREKLGNEHLSDYNAGRTDSLEVKDRLAESVLENLQIVTTRDSRVVALNFTSNDPEVAAEVSNGFANAYIDTSLELSIAPARRNAQWFDAQLVSLRDRLAEKQALLTAYQREKGILSYDERLDNEMSRYEKLSSDLIAAQRRTFEVRAGQLGAQHPEYRRAIEQERAIQASLERQERQMFQVKEERDALELLVQDVQNARRSYDLALQEFYESSMKSQFNQTNVAILSQATPPTRSAGPSIVSRSLGAATLGFLLGIMLVVGVELLSRRIRTEEDIVDGLNLRVIASI